MIVVTTPTGQIGQEVVRILLDANRSVRVIARDPDMLPRPMLDRVNVIQGSHGDSAIVERALTDADTLFWVAPPDMKQTPEQAYVEFTRPAADVIRRLGGKRVVSVTGIGRGTAWADRAGLVTASMKMDDLLASSAAAFRALAMPSFMENFTRQAGVVKDQGVMTGTMDPDRKVPWTSTRDLAAVAAQLLRDGAWTGNDELSVLGPDVLSLAEIALLMSEAAGRDVRYQQIPFDTLKAQFLKRGASESFAQGYVDMYRAKNEGMDNTAVTRRAEHTPTGFREWCNLILQPMLLN
ncbi:NAD(P)H-binding protein [Paraburkholderia sp. J76]|uniref:NmrA family NAD(P)-binding protein n=1 Tax=Paraburkholderia sp. J76 TaxID=2805439 RepID=UPI002ABE4D5C|nr:NAD(P)H-binding protein [Paraburkholderia sp. J76]